jgi:hypothetical protein
MALLFLDGCDLHGSNADILRRWTAATSSTNVDVLTTGGRFGGGCIRLRTTSGEETLTKTLAAPITDTAIIGAAIRLVPNITTSTGNNRLVQFADSAGTTHLTLAWSSADQLFRLYRGTTAGTLLATSAVTFAPDAWAHLELKASIADSGGICVVRLDGAEIISFTGDTRNAGTAEVATVRFSSHFQSNDRYDLRLDDVYLCDDTGSRNNDLLGDVRVTTLRPDADTAQADFTPLGGGAHYLEVDDAPSADGDASYLESGTVGHQERLGLEDLASTPAAILAVQLATVARKDDAGSRSLRAILKSGAVTANGTTRVLATSYTLYDDRFETDPATGGDWSKPAIDALEPGVEITA